MHEELRYNWMGQKNPKNLWGSSIITTRENFHISVVCFKIPQSMNKTFSFARLDVTVKWHLSPQSKCESV